MNQPPANLRPDAPLDPRPPSWRRPPGVAPGTWDYVHQRSIADHYDAFVADTPLCRLDQRVVARELPLDDGSKNSWILDLGCGNGRIAIELLHRGHGVIGVDLSQRMLELCVEKAITVNRNEWLLPVRANLVELGCIADACADHAVCMFSSLGMIQGRENRQRVLKHASRIVRPGGTLVVHVHHRWAALWEPGGLRALAKSRWASWIRRDQDFGDSVYEYRGLSRMFLHRFSRPEIHADLNSSGWTIDKTLAISLDGSRVLDFPMEKRWRAGGFFVIARRR